MYLSPWNCLQTSCSKINTWRGPKLSVFFLMIICPLAMGCRRRWNLQLKKIRHFMFTYLLGWRWHLLHLECGGQRTTWERWLSLSNMWVVGIELRSIRLVARAFTCWGISVAIYEEFNDHYKCSWCVCKVDCTLCSCLYKCLERGNGH